MAEQKIRQQQYQNAIQDVVYLAKCAVTGEAPDKHRVADMDLEQLYKFACRHLLTAIIAMALESAGVFDKAFTQAKGKAFRKLAAMDVDMAALFRAFDTMGIWYMPLKGAVLKDYYPAYGMRQMSDRDILFDATRADDVRVVLEGMGYFCVSFGKGVDDVYRKEPVCSFEMHRALFGDEHDKRLDAYYRDVEARIQHVSGYSRCLSNEDFYIYITAHEFKHYSNSGTGLRSILDIYVFLTRFTDSLDWKYITEEFEKLGIAGFERRNRNLALRLFNGEALTREDEEMLDYIVNSGTYGSLPHCVINHVKKLGDGRRGKLRYLARRIFLPMERVKMCYPFFYRHKALLPVLYVWRVIRGLTVHGSRSMIKSELETLAKYKA